ncbi:MAG TPA: hypothetical protein VNC23_03780 [Lapillicoccus sp.]|jgi:hypothetical protein|nr:hypothetical protein [Lapillicoccus sp.]
MSSSTSRPPFQVNPRLLKPGLVLLCVGGGAWLAGALLSGTALAQATWRFIEQLDESPAEIANRRFQQMKVAAAAASKAWNESAR